MIINPYIYIGGSAPGAQPNTFIGGLGSLYPDKVSLATALSIDSNSVNSYSIKNGNISCIISQSYSLPDNFGDANLTYFIDEGDNCTYAGRFFNAKNNLRYLYFSAATNHNSYYFYGGYALDSLELPGMVSVPDNGFQGSGTQIYRLQRLDIRNVTSLGTSAGASGMFTGLPLTNVIIYCNTALQTSNGGSEEGDIAFARGQGAIIRYVQNETAPNAVSDLASVSVSATHAKLTCSAPSSTNTIEFYEVYVDGVYNSRWTKPEDVNARFLTAGTSYGITVKAVDIYNNKSEVSNTVSIVTAASENYSIDTLYSYLKFENDLVDSLGLIKNPTPTNIAYQAALSGNAVYFDGTAKIQLPANILRKNVSAFSFSFLLKADDTAAEYRLFSLNNNSGGPYVSFRINQGGTANKIYVLVYDGASKELISTSYTVTNDTHVLVSIAENGNATMFINGNSVGSVAIGTFTQVSANGNFLGSNRNGTAALAKSLMDGLAFWDGETDATSASGIASKQLAGEELI